MIHIEPANSLRTLAIHLLALVLWLIVLTATPLRAVSLRVVVSSDDPAPGLPEGIRFGSNSLFISISDLTIDSNGFTSFRAPIFGSGVNGNTNEGIWSEKSGRLELVSREGDQAADRPSGVRLVGNRLSNQGLMFNAAGDFSFGEALVGDGIDSTNNAGIWVERDDVLSLVALKGQEAPGTLNGIHFSNLFRPALNENGDVAFSALLTGDDIDGSPNQGIWIEKSGTLSSVAVAGQQTPGTSEGVLFRNFYTPTLNPLGHVAFVAGLTGDGVGRSSDDGIWAFRDGELSLVVRSSELAPGVSGNSTFNNFQNQTPVMNSNGLMAFGAELSTRQSNGFATQGIWTDYLGTQRLVALSETHAPGTPLDISFKTFVGLRTMVNSSGDLAFLADLDGDSVDDTNDYGIWSEISGSLNLVVREGEHAPGTSAGTMFDQISLPAFNDLGQVAFSATLTGEGVGESNDQGVWVGAQEESLELILRKGDRVRLGPGDFRTIGNLGLLSSTTNINGRPTNLSDEGHLAFLAIFTDGTQAVMVADTSVVPEPTTFALASAALCLALRARR